MIVREKRSLISIFDKPSTLSVFSKSVLVQMSIVSSSGSYVKRESTCRLPTKYSGSCSKISSAKLNEHFTVYSLLVNDFKIRTLSGRTSSEKISVTCKIFSCEYREISRGIWSTIFYPVK